MKLAVFASGSGSNFEAIVGAVHAGDIAGTVQVLICDKGDAFALERAERLCIPAYVLEPRKYGSKVEYEEAVLQVLRSYEVELIILAGYMRLVGDTLLSAYENRIINIHPSLLPAFPGLDAIGQAFDAGVKITGVTVHYVDAGMDTGPIIAQEAVKVEDSDNKEAVQRKIQAVEHSLYPKTVQHVIEDLGRRINQ
ncbi:MULTISPECIES: phosphoribosylglycinamide formyltransferase [Bacillaceae]|uniref:Phosphoribosylglycinamide formyltransferase n=1 Tax=Evansella alkalicola TaxID=745819 RepID=A0ABS6JRQ9_9BACI|nr:MULTISPECIES: phosphoribosylglycinamide formyltransferase [Bacillaceae]MBU9721256.1 phosphoribosylglycinamide formyltransferase [Bacillus alkalicola]